MEVCKQKFPVIQYFELPPQIAVDTQCSCIGGLAVKWRNKKRKPDINANVKWLNRVKET
jgi:hypothetical protein